MPVALLPLLVLLQYLVGSASLDTVLDKVQHQEC